MQNVDIEVSLTYGRPRSERLAAKRALKKEAVMGLIEELLEDVSKNNKKKELQPSFHDGIDSSDKRKTRMLNRKRRSNDTVIEFYNSPIKKSRPSSRSTTEVLRNYHQDTIEDLVPSPPSSQTSTSPQRLPAHIGLVSLSDKHRPPTPDGSPGLCMFESPEAKGWSNSLKLYVEDDEIDYSGGFTPYEHDAYLFRFSREMRFHPLLSLRNQPQVSPYMRGVLVDWLTKLNHHFKFSQETLFLAVNVMDRFLLTTPISRDCFQLLGITTFLIAAKMEEVTPPDQNELIKLCCYAFSTSQLLQLELIVLTRINFDLFVPTSQYFFEFFCATCLRKAYLSGSNRDYMMLTRALGRYMLEQCLQSYSICQHQPSLLACSVMELAHTYLHFVKPPESRYTRVFSRVVLERCIRHVKEYTIDHMTDDEIPKICEKYMSISRKDSPSKC